jgi:hypothetical protein
MIGKAGLTADDGIQRPRLAVNGSGDAIVAWQESHYNGSQFEYYIGSARYDSSLASWQTATNASTNVSEPKNWPAVAIDPSGNAYVAWQQTPASSSEDDGWASRFNAASKTWEAQTLFETDTAQADRIAIDVDADGNALFVWQQGPINARWYNAASGWTDTSSIMSALLLYDHSLDVNSSGNAVVVSSQEVNNLYSWDWCTYAVHYVKP